MSSSTLLKILFAEDLPSDAELAVMELRKEGLIFEHIVVDTRAEFVKALKEFRPDIVISDYIMPSYSGLEALKDTYEFDPRIPFILFTGSINEEIAVQCIKAGATDYVIKEHMTRLPFAVNEALEQKEIQIEKRVADLLLRDSQERIQSMFRAAPAGMGLVAGRVFLEVNDTFCALTGYSREELIGKHVEIIYPSKEISDFVGIEKYRLIAENGTGTLETTLKCKDGKIINVIMSATPVDKNELSKGVSFFVLDITERIKTEKALEAREEIFSHFMENSPIYVFFKDSGIRSLRLSKNYEKLIGRPMEELLGKTMDELFPSDLAKKMVDDDLKTMKDGRPVEIQEIFNGRLYNTIKFPIFIDGKPTYLAGYTIDITDQKLAESSLKSSLSVLNTSLESTADGILIVDGKGGIIKWNHKFAEMWGIPVDLLEGRDDKATIDFIINELKDPEKFLSIIRELSDSPEKSSFDILEFIDGRIFERYSQPQKIDDIVVGRVWSFRDVTERHIAEEALKLSEEKFRSIAENLTDVIFITDLKGIVTYISPSSKTFGYTPEECVGRYFGEFLPEGELEKAIPLFMNALNPVDQISAAKLMIKRKDGTVFPAEITGSLFKVGNGKTGILGLLRDITLRQKLEAETVANEQRYRELFLNNPVPTYIFDENSLEFIEVNDATIQNYGYTEEEFASMTLKDIRLPEDIADLMESVVDLGKEVFHSVSMRHRKKDGTVFPVEITSHSLPEKCGRKSRLVMAVDITERLHAAEQMKLAKEKAEASDKLKTSFLNNISHEVRTPLNGILGFAEIVSQPDLGETEKKECISMLFDSSDRLLNTITNYMDISLITSGNMTVYNRTYCPGKILRKIDDNYRNLCAEKNLNLLLDIPENSDSVYVNSDQEIFRKIMTHLLDNAVKFTEKGSITFGFKTSKEELEFFVKDTGTGIAEESVKFIFDQFAKEDQGPLKISEGSGLGLSISKGLVELLGGRISVESEKGRGSSFYFTIPADTVNPGDAAIPQASANNKGRKSCSILVAEDDETNYFYLHAVLKQNTNSELIHALNGKEAVDKFLENPDIGLILMDIKMPVLNGLEATRQIKAINPAIPVIAITAYAMAGDESRILEAGCDRYLTKPIDKKLLLEMISEYIKI